MINDILHIVKLESDMEKLSICRVDVKTMLEAVMGSVFPLLQDKGHELRQEIADNLPAVYWDEQKIRQVVLNLLTNAIKFTPQSGHILIRAEVADPQRLSIQVIDSGIGVADDMKDRVFLYFEQAESGYTRIYQGVGLGLAISKSMVALHSGKIWLEGTPGGGVKACVILLLEPFSRTEILG